MKAIEPMMNPAFVIDVQTLGKEVFQIRDGFLQDLLENDTLKKVTFDCRSDSDALCHQFGVNLSNVLDLQVYDQAVRIHRGSPPPTRRGSFLPFVPPMKVVSSRHVNFSEVEMLRAGAPAPHKTDEQVWGKRPLPSAAWLYAAADAHLIDLVFRSMNKCGVPKKLMDGVHKHSDRYAKVFRERRIPVRHRHSSDKYVIMEEISILT
jgi:ribonuclease D